MTCGWRLVSSNDEGIEIYEQAKEVLFYDYWNERVIGVFNKQFYEKATQKTKKNDEAPFTES